MPYNPNIVSQMISMGRYDLLPTYFAETYGWGQNMPTGYNPNIFSQMYANPQMQGAIVPYLNNLFSAGPQSQTPTIDIGIPGTPNYSGGGATPQSGPTGGGGTNTPTNPVTTPESGWPYGPGYHPPGTEGFYESGGGEGYNPQQGPGLPQPDWVTQMGNSDTYNQGLKTLGADIKEQWKGYKPSMGQLPEALDLENKIPNLGTWMSRFRNAGQK